MFRIGEELGSGRKGMGPAYDILCPRFSGPLTTPPPLLPTPNWPIWSLGYGKPLPVDGRRNTAREKLKILILKFFTITYYN